MAAKKPKEEGGAALAHQEKVLCVKRGDGWHPLKSHNASDSLCDAVLDAAKSQHVKDCMQGGAEYPVFKTELHTIDGLQRSVEEI